ncbi:alpha/beta hydrolase-fold protein [Nocardia sp. NPDC050712]|uniref:alpha/beta hydrolase n=1 Tax=Nocardia sp. NPDC050712 TaxID=3155518 RepID=UPI003403F4FA
MIDKELGPRPAMVAPARRARLAAVIAPMLLTGLLSAGPATAQDTPQCLPRTTPPVAHLEQVSATPVDARTTLYAFRSAAAGRVAPDGLVRVRVTLPVGYEEETTRYPVLVHLHGARNSPTTWPAAEVEQVIGDTPVIVVQPDGGPVGFYSDWYGTPVSGSDPFNGPIAFPPPAWETFHLRELLPWVDSTFSTTGHRAVAGSSMGGFGAMSYAARNPGVFDAAAAFSGAVNVDALSPAVSSLLQLAEPCIWGDRTQQAANWDARNPTALAGELHGTSLYVTAGDGRPGVHDDATTAISPLAGVEVLMRQLSDDFVAALDRNGVPVTTEFHHGTHPGPIELSRHYDFDALRAFLPQAMTAMTRR